LGVKCARCPVFIDKKYVISASSRLFGEFIGLTTLLIVLAAFSAAYFKHLPYWLDFPSP
jgi:hypothetical protein